ncbi:MAG: VOC family protein [Bacteroidia bacterium]
MHVSLYVSDLGKTINFYNQFFGQTPTKIKTAYAKYELDNPSLVISFIENKERVSTNFGHLGWRVSTEEELKKYMELSESKGIIDLVEEGTSCCYAVQDKFWVNDPDGTAWEVYYFHEDSEFNDPKYSNGESNACCTPLATKTKKSIAEIAQPSCC